MFAIISTNLLRRPARTIFTALGIALGVATIVALLSFTEGLKQTAAGFVHLGGSDLGIFQANVADPTASVLPVSMAQQLVGRPGEATDIVVQLAPGTRASSAAKSLEHAFIGTQVITDPQQALRAGANGTLISKAILVIVVIALIVGAISVANTMAMSIMERQRELGLLGTVGWSPVRVASLILGEGVAVSVLGAAVGLFVGVIGGGLLVRALGVSSYVSPSVTAWGLGRGLLVGVAIGVLGGIYPAWRVTRMTPLRALSGT